MPAKISDRKRKQIEKLLAEGKSRNSIVKLAKVSNGTVTLVAKKCGHTFGQTNMERAREARKAYCAEARAEVAKAGIEQIKKEQAEFENPAEVYAFGGKDGDFKSKKMQTPPPDIKLTRAKTIKTLSSAMMEIVKYDEPKPQEVSGPGGGPIALTVTDLIELAEKEKG